MDSAYVRICCTGIVHDVPVISGRCTVCGKSCLHVHHLHFMGIHFLYIRKYSIWIHGICYFQRAEGPKLLICVPFSGRYAGRYPDRYACTDGGILHRWGRKQGRIRVQNFHDRRNLFRTCRYLLSVMLYADNRTCRVCTEAGCPEEDVRTDGFRTVFQQIADGPDSLGSAVVVGIFNVPGHQPVSVCRLL